MQLNTRTAMLRGLELRKKLGSWEAVEQLGRPVDDMIDSVRPATNDDETGKNGVHHGE